MALVTALGLVSGGLALDAAAAGERDQLAEVPEVALIGVEPPADSELSSSSATGSPSGPTSRAVPEFRAAWADTWHAGLLSADQVTDLVNTLAGANYNAVIAEIRKCGDAYYESAYEPRATNIVDPPPFDPLADLITKAHAANLEVHAWAVTYRIWASSWGPAPADHVWTLHPEWALEHRDGGILDGNYYNLDPGVPGVQDYICKVAVDVVSKYDVDGFNWDYIRYPSGYYWGYNDITEQRFFDEYGFWPPTSTSDPEWETWADYRRRQVTDLVRKCSLEIWALRPEVTVSVDTVGWMGGDPNADFSQTRQYKEVFQDGKGWLEQHLVDANILMNYKREHDPGQQADYRAWSRFIGQLGAAAGRWGIGGQGAYLNSIGGSLAQMTAVRDAGCTGGATYSYAVTNKDGHPNSWFYHSVRANLYPTPALIPDAPWKSAPTRGILFGTVISAARPPDPIYESWVYQATVTASGPVVRSTLTDATGTYGFIDLPPGTYHVSAEGAGLPEQTHRDVTVAAGEIVRRDFDLSDRDGDGSVAADDCDDSNDEVWSSPGEARALAFEGPTTLVWEPPDDAGGLPSSLVYDLLRAPAPTGFAEAVCVESNDGSDTVAEDAHAPPAGAASFYLVRADNACPGDGPLGRASDGAARNGRPCD